MNMHATCHTRTPAETALIEAFGERLSQLPGDGAVMVKRDNAIEAIKAGLPTRRIEAWHYTDLRRLLTAVPALRCRQPTPKPVDAADRGLDGAAGAERRRRASRTLPIEGVTVQRLAEKLHGRQLRAGAGSARRRRCHRRASTRPSSPTAIFVDIADGAALDSADRTAERAGWRPDACALAGARRRRRQGDDRRAPDRQRRRAGQLGQPICWSATVPRSSGSSCRISPTARRISASSMPSSARTPG